MAPIGYSVSAVDDRAPQRLAAYAGIVGIVIAVPAAWLDPGGLDTPQLAILLGISAVVAMVGVAFCSLTVNARDPGRRVSAVAMGLGLPFALVDIAVLERLGWGGASVILGPVVGPAVVTFLAARHRLLGRDRWRLLGGVALGAIVGWLAAAVAVTLWTVSQSSGPESPDSGAMSGLPPGFRSVQESERFVVWTDLQSAPDLLSEANVH